MIRQAAVRAQLTLETPLDLGSTLSPSHPWRSGTDGVWRATRTPDGPGSQHLWVEGGHLISETWGPGAEWLAARLAVLVAEGSCPPPFTAPHPLLRDLRRRLPGLRIPRTESVYEAAVAAVLSQLVTSEEFRAARRRLLWEFGEEAPGPLPMRLVPEPRRLLTVPYWSLHRMGVERRRAETLYRVAQHAARLEEAATMDLPAAYRRIRAISGLGAWSAAEIAIVALGDADAVAVGDFHLRHLVSWALAGEERGSDDRMLELLEPYRGSRGLVLRLLEHGHVRYPAHGPKHPVRDLRRM